MPEPPSSLRERSPLSDPSGDRGQGRAELAVLDTFHKVSTLIGDREYSQVSGQWIACTNRWIWQVRYPALTVSGLGGDVSGRQRPAAAAGARRPATGGSGVAAGAWRW